MPADSELKIGRRKVRVSNLQKVFYPETGFTKGDVIAYYLKISSVLLPHLKNRPVTLKRYPDGVTGEFFYEKQCPSHAPDWVPTTPVERSDGEIINYCLINDPATLIWAANIANLELHPFTHTARAHQKPLALVFDLDPGPPADVIDCCQVAIWIRDFLAGMGLESWVKTSGSKGLQMVVPLNTRTTYQKTKTAAHAIADALAKRFPDKVVSDMKKDLRHGKVFIDWSQNDDKKTTVSVYSLRAKDAPTASTPVAWDEVEHAMKKKKASLLTFEASEVLERVERNGDLLAPVLTVKQKLPPALTRLKPD